MGLEQAIISATPTFRGTIEEVLLGDVLGLFTVPHSENRQRALHLKIT